MLYIVAHGVDVDGISAHALIERYARNIGIETKHYFVDYQNIILAFEEISKIILPEDSVIIADIGYSEELVKIFLNEYKDIAEKTSWFDHHRWNSDVKNIIGNAVREIIVDESRCAAEIVKDGFLSSDEFAANLACMARAHDFYGKGSAADIFGKACKIQDVITSGYDKMKIVEILSSGNLWNEGLEAVYVEYKKIRACAIENMNSAIVRYLMISKNEAVNVTAVFVSNVLESKDVRAYLMNDKKRKNERDVVIAVWPSGRIAYEVRDEKDRTIIDKINRNFNGGGRGLAGGATFPRKVNEINYGKCLDEIIEAIKE
jgi:oligoribonuclease NrnB/cAMP/cGMP phosphodiesterase (DHH superfamily)